MKSSAKDICKHESTLNVHRRKNRTNCDWHDEEEAEEKKIKIHKRNKIQI